MRANSTIEVARPAQCSLLGDEQQRHLAGIGGELALAVAKMEERGKFIEFCSPGGVGERQRIELGCRCTPLWIRGIVDNPSSVAHDRLECFQLPKHCVAEIRRALQAAVAVQPAADRRPLLPVTLKMHAVAIEQATHTEMIGVDPLGPTLDVLVVGER